MVKSSGSWRPNLWSCSSKLLVGRGWGVSLIGPWLEACSHFWTKPCDQKSDLPHDSWLEGQLHAKHVATVGVGISPETKSSNWGKRQQNNRCPWQLTWKRLSANIPKITWIHNRWVSQKSLLVMAQKSSPAFANLKPDTVSVRFLFFFHDVRSLFQLMFSFFFFF